MANAVHTIDDARELIDGYANYTNVNELGADATDEAPAVTPAVLSFIATSTVACGAGISVIGGSVVGTVSKGC